MSIEKKNDLLMTKISNYFIKNDSNIKYLISILNNDFQISLRIIDWFVTNYSKKNNIYWIINNDRFVVYINYKSQLKAYSKKYFDPFCRRERIYYYYNENDYIITTIGQLNFFKWSIENNIIEYIKNNYKEIENDMHNSLKNNYYNKGKNKKKIRRELSVSTTKTINKTQNKTIINFN
tara:strand:+ start:398 stop:931 length:534 start_codon:yes stop_codon:yes gene_type:complete